MEGGSQAQDHGQAIYGKIRYSVSSTFATGCSSAAATVQGSIATVLDSLSGSTSLITNPKDIFVSSDIPIDMSVFHRLKRKIWAHEYVDFGLLADNKKDHDSFHLCLSTDMASSNDQPLITLEPKSKSKHINSIEMWVTALSLIHI